MVSKELTAALTRLASLVDFEGNEVTAFVARIADEIERLRLASAEHYDQWGKWQKRADELAAELRVDQARIDELKAKLKAKKDAGPETIP